MNDPGVPRPRGRHASPDNDASGVPAAWTTPLATGPAYGPTYGPTYGRRSSDSVPRPADARSREDARSWADARSWEDEDTAARPHRRADVFAGTPTSGGMRRVSGLLDHYPEDTGPGPFESRYHSGEPDRTQPPSSFGNDARSARRAPSGDGDDSGRHPSAPLPPLPPGAWSRLSRRADAPDDAPTQAQPVLPSPPSERAQDDQALDEHALEDHALEDHALEDHALEDHALEDHALEDEAPTDAHHFDEDWHDQTGGLEVLGEHVDDDAGRRGRWRRRSAEQDPDLHDDAHDDDLHDDFHDDDFHDGAHGGGIPLEPYERRGGRGRRRRPLAVLVALLVLGGLVLGIVVGGQKLLGLFTAKDYTGQGTGSVDVRVQNGDTLSDIGRTLVAADVIASVRPFVDAAKTEPNAMGITAGVYRMHKQMSGAAALHLLLDPTSRLVSRVTIPEGLTMASTLQRIADTANLPVADLQAAAADPVALGLPAYASGSLEGFLFPATYDIEPGDTAADVLRKMVTRTTQALDQLQVPEDQRLSVLTKASMVQAEASSTEDMAKVARVLENRLAIGMPLQLDTTVNYANGKSGITTTPEDRANPSPYNTYLHPGPPPGPIGNPGEDAIRAVLAPAAGDWLFFVVVNPDTHETRFAATAEEHQANVALFQQWLREHPGG